MEEFQFKGHWNQLKGTVKEKWGKLTDDDLLAIDGQKDQLIGRLQVLYGLDREKINRDILDIESTYYNDQFSQRWSQLKANMRSKWDVFTDEDIYGIGGQSDRLIAQLQARYRFDRNKAEAEFHGWIDSLDATQDKPSDKANEQQRL